jgi:MFS superfamily sulfate permease-like transporter
MTSNTRPGIVQSIPSDLSAGLVVFLVATPLCLGIALASGAPFFSGIIAGIIGGLVVPLISRSEMSVSGPAAGLTAVVLIGIGKIGSFEGFLLALVLAGLIQMALAVCKAGFVAYYFPSSVIKGMLAAIGLILIFKQLPHAFGYNAEHFADLTFWGEDGGNMFTLLAASLGKMQPGALVISIFSLGVLIGWENSLLSRIHWLPGALVVVVGSVALNYFFAHFFSYWELGKTHLVSLPEINQPADFFAGFAYPDFTLIGQAEVWTTGLTIGLVASIETLLTIEAVDKIDPYRRKSPLNRELMAQGVGNTLSGFIGGLPITSVIVRSSAGINAGARTRMTAFFHGMFMLVAVLFLSHHLNKVPMACLAAILLVVGYKLAKPSLFRKMFREGMDQFLPFLITIIAILLTDLLKGVGIGVVAGLVFVIRTNFHSALSVIRHKNQILLRFNRDVSFLNKALIVEALAEIPEGMHVTIDGTRARFLDHDILEALEDFRIEAHTKGITVEFRNINSLKMVNTKLKFVDV